MSYKKIACDEYNIHLIKNNKFHTIEFRVCFTENATKRKVTYRNVLAEVLAYATKNYDTKKRLLEKCQELYAISPRASSSRIGKLLTTRFSISMSDSVYINKNNILENILLLKEIILNPLIIDGGFKKEYFEITKNELECETLTTKEDPRLYANLSLIKLMDEGKDELISSFCDINILRKMTEKSLYKEYLKLLKESNIDIYISGNIKNEKEIIDTIKSNFIFHNKKIQLDNKNIIYRNIRKEPLFIKEINHYQQSKLSIGLKLFNLDDYENKYVLMVLNNLFGGGANSLLMQYVRLKNNLCYYVGSFSNRLDNYLIVNSGINKENYEETLTLTKKCFQMLQEGKFSKSLLKKSIMECVVEVENIVETQRGLLDYYYGHSVLDTDPLKVKLDKIKHVSKEDIIKLANKMTWDIIFFLEGDL